MCARRHGWRSAGFRVQSANRYTTGPAAKEMNSGPSLQIAVMPARCEKKKVRADLTCPFCGRGLLVHLLSEGGKKGAVGQQYARGRTCHNLLAYEACAVWAITACASGASEPYRKATPHGLEPFGQQKTKKAYGYSAKGQGQRRRMLGRKNLQRHMHMCMCSGIRQCRTGPELGTGKENRDGERGQRASAEAVQKKLLEAGGGPNTRPSSQRRSKKIAGSQKRSKAQRRSKKKSPRKPEGEVQKWGPCPWNTGTVVLAWVSRLCKQECQGTGALTRRWRLRDGLCLQTGALQSLCLPLESLGVVSLQARMPGYRSTDTTVLVVPLHTHAYGGVEVFCVRAGLYLLVRAAGGMIWSLCLWKVSVQSQPHAQSPYRLVVRTSFLGFLLASGVLFWGSSGFRALFFFGTSSGFRGIVFGPPSSRFRGLVFGPPLASGGLFLEPSGLRRLVLGPPRPSGVSFLDLLSLLGNRFWTSSGLRQLVFWIPFWASRRSFLDLLSLPAHRFWTSFGLPGSCFGAPLASGRFFLGPPLASTPSCLDLLSLWGPRFWTFSGFRGFVFGPPLSSGSQRRSKSKRPEARGGPQNDAPEAREGLKTNPLMREEFQKRSPEAEKVEKRRPGS